MEKTTDWHKLKQDYIFGSTESVSDFLRQQGFKPNGYLTRKTYGWNKEREKYIETLDNKTIEMTISKISETESEIRMRQAESARKLQAMALKALDKYEPSNAEEARRMLVDGLKEEREAIGLNKNNQNPDSKANNVPIMGMGTRFSEALKEANLDQLIEFLGKTKTHDNSPQVKLLTNPIN